MKELGVNGMGLECFQDLHGIQEAFFSDLNNLMRLGYDGYELRAAGSSETSKAWEVWTDDHDDGMGQVLVMKISTVHSVQEVDVSRFVSTLLIGFEMGREEGSAEMMRFNRRIFEAMSGGPHAKWLVEALWEHPEQREMEGLGRDR